MQFLGVYQPLAILDASHGEHIAIIALEVNKSFDYKFSFMLRCFHQPSLGSVEHLIAMLSVSEAAIFSTVFEGILYGLFLIVHRTKILLIVLC